MHEAKTEQDEALWDLPMTSPSFSPILSSSPPLSLTALCISRAETTLAELLGVSPSPTANPPIEK